MDRGKVGVSLGGYVSQRSDTAVSEGCRMPDAKLATALVFVTARNCEAYVEACLKSLSRQTLTEIHVLFIDDCSEDRTGEIARQYLDGHFPSRHTFIRNDIRMGKARNAWEHLRPRTGMAEFIAVLDGDDLLAEPSILGRMAESYRAGKDVVWTNYFTDKGLIGGCGPLDPDVPPREQGWKTSHFFSFRASLLDTVPEDYFKDGEGEWLQAACDIALALPMLDQTRRYEFIPVNAYRYTSSNPLSHHNMDPSSHGFSSAAQKECARHVFSKPPLPLRVSGAEAEFRPARREALPRPAAARPAVSATEIGKTWQDLAGHMLMAECPRILNAMAFCGHEQMTPVQAWALRGLLQERGEAARILHIGATRSALVLAALASTFGAKVTCLSASSVEAQELLARAKACGLIEWIDIVQTGLVQALFDEFSGPFPDVRAIGETAKFDVVMIDLPRGVPQDSALVSLSVVAGHLAPEGFSLCLMTGDRTTETLAEERWRPISSGLTFCPDAIGGSGLMVTAG